MTQMNQIEQRPSEDTLSVGGDEVTFKVTSERSGGGLLAYEVAFSAGGGPPVLHRHPGFELIRVEAGELTFYVEGDSGEIEPLVAGQGSVIPIPGGREHTIRNESDADAKAFVVFTPGEAMESFIRAAAAADDMADAMRVAEEHGIEMTRPVEEVS